MKIQSKTISIDIDLDEWKKIKKEWKDNICYADKPKKYSYADNPNLEDFMTSIDLIANNRNHTIDKKLNTY
jgi:hypothetical protein